jgi:hypothetical protein
MYKELMKYQYLSAAEKTPDIDNLSVILGVIHDIFVTGNMQSYLLIRDIVGIMNLNEAGS